MSKYLRIIYLLFGAGVLIYLGIVAALKIYVETYTQAPVGAPVSAIIVLAAGPVNSERDNRTAIRTLTGAKLYADLVAAGEAPVLVLAGGQEPAELRPKAAGMAEVARDAGVPEADLRLEDRSRSTLQNAMFSNDLIEGGFSGRVVIITERFHLPRSWASFRWAGASEVLLLASDRPDEDVDWDNLFREALKWPFNAARAVAYSLLVALGWNEDDLIALTN